MVLTALFWVFATETADAQRFEWVYGGDNCIEDGQFRVIPVTGGCGAASDCMGGYIAVGTSFSVDPNCATSDVYVVRTDNCGMAFWEMTYDITGNNLDDMGFSIIEVANQDGFIITGAATTPNGDLDAFLMEIDCMGTPRWTQTYGSPAGDEIGRDLVEAQTGSGANMPPTFVGDILVAGRTNTNPVGTWDGYLFRARRAGGILVWDASYNSALGPLNEWFHSLTEAAPSPGSATPTGDIVAVGGRDIGGGIQGYIVRASGDNGTITVGAAFAQNSAEYGIPGYDDEFYSVIELQNPAEIGPMLGLPNVVVAGYGTVLNQQTGAAGIDNFTVKLADGNPCTPMLQVMSGDGTGPITDRIHTIRELPAPMGPHAAFDLIATGVTDFNGNNDVHLLSIAPLTLAPNGTVSNTYGGGSTDEGWSTFPVYTDAIGHLDGFVACGLTQSGLGGVPDPQDLYLIRTNPFGLSGCEMGYNVNPLQVNNWVCANENLNAIRLNAPYNTPHVNRFWGLNVCVCQTPKLAPETGESPIPANAILTEASLLPNPIKTGNAITLSVRTVDEATVEIVVTNSLGENVVTQQQVLPSGMRDLTLQTTDWPSGVYHVSLDDGVYTHTLHVVVAE